MLRKILACLMALTLSVFALTASAYFAADSVLVLNPADRVSSAGTLGSVVGEVVDIPSELLSEVSSEDSSSSSLEESSSSSSSSLPVSVVEPPSQVPSNSSTVTIPPSVSSSPSSQEPSSGGESSSGEPSSGESSSDEGSSSEPAPTQETLIVKIASEPEVGVYEVDDILPRIVAMEMNDTFADEALKAQAVAAHSYIKYLNLRGQAPVVAVRTPSARIQSLVESVSSQMIYYGGSVIDATYTASTAGRTESSVDVWGGYLPYLVSVESVYDNLDPNYGDTVTYTVDQVKEMVLRNAGITLEGDPSAWFQVESTTSGGYNGDMTLGGNSVFTNNGKNYRVTGRNIQTMILKGSGLPTLKSHKFDVTVSGDQMIFTTYGYGHGVGMSQWGAHYYASKGGLNYVQILTHYYSGTTVR
ncbi:MAG: SpoIID/LytB domain-containing protein [Oscillospiraceae bacterium]